MLSQQSLIKSSTFSYLKLMRIDHWIKNLFMIPGAIFALSFEFLPKNQELTKVEFTSLAISFLALSFASSANYVMNEWLDRTFDAKHPFKNHRVSNLYSFSPKNVWLLYGFNIFISLSLLQFLNRETVFYITLLLIMGVLYNVKPIRLKDRQYLDVISESLNNPIRLAIGWHAIIPNQLVPASAFIGFWGIGIFLMSLKRYVEMSLINNKELLGSYRKSFKKWNPQDLLIFAISGALVASSFIGIFLVRHRVEYIFLFPPLIWIFAQYLKISLNLEPVSFAPEKLMRDKNLMLLVLILAIFFIIFTFLDVPNLTKLIDLEF